VGAFVIIHQLAYEGGTGSVPKRRHIKFRRRGITQKETNKKNKTLFRKVLKSITLNVLAHRRQITCVTGNSG
jgi:hypothetical protein